jgi:polysaccharide pyruvyl transferase WcaK-like protein
LSERHELPKWRGLLRHFGDVTVRGPRSAELLADVGIQSRVVGDPALLLDPAEGTIGAAITGETATRERGTGGAPLLGVNLGVSDDLWGHDQAHVVDEVAVALKKLAQSGWRFRALVVNPADRPDAVRCGRMAGLSAERWDIVDAAEPQAYLRAVEPCRLLIAERLHAGVLAARMGVPPITLEYQPKCRDFLRSVGLERLGLRTDALSADALLDLVGASDAEHHAITETLGQRVGALRATLATEAQTIAARAAGTQAAA